ncbi:O-antigen ligase family protein [Akkermansia muciniphila]|uniref:O-antigen ligase family protein n=1 Tax=Akkermansia muciniphila TaxID=239935 RepID=UPI0027D21C2F|nr:O-antigen ligase family protein [Akkermansia muciniphila]WMB15384.1 O-antigen ligase family protein [Akkermansia muciniphila]WMB19956.1 O-antigen ligase family protein [Akkermansia muciniphila]
MPASPPSTAPAPRIAETAAGKALAVLLVLFYIFLVTTAAGGEWHTLFLPACFLAAALLLFCFCILRGYKIPSPGLPGWLALGLGGGYFLVRAWFSPWFYYESVADLGLIATAVVMFAAGTYAGAGNGEKSILPILAASLGLLNALLWGYQNITGTESSWFRPDYSLFGSEIRNIGLFGYKNFSAHFLSVTGFFLCSYSMASARKWGIRLFTGVALILVSFTCGSRSAFPNALAGVTLCFFIYTSSVFRNNRKFYTASILFIILLLLGTSYAVLDLSRGAGRLAVLLDTFSFGNRLDLSKLAWALADQSPLFGHGSRMFTNLSTEFFSGANLPNFAHHEYAQAACDYGYAGLGLMLALLALFLISGLRSVLKLSGEHQRSNPLGPAAFCVLCIAAFHAYGEFIWHNPALLGASALCGGITCTAPLSRVKASRRAGRWLQASAALLLAILALCYAFLAFPVWKNSLQAVPASSSKRLPMLEEAASRSLDPDLVRRNILHAAGSSPLPSPVQLKALEYQEEKAELLSPGNHGLTAAKSLLYILQGRLTEAEQLLRPYVESPGRFDDRMFAWTTIYNNMLYSWSTAIAAQSPGRALSMAMTAQRLMSAQTNQWLYYGALDPEVRKQHYSRLNELKMLIMTLQSRGAVPDTSWRQ